jgi:hypothetical protein
MAAGEFRTGADTYKHSGESQALSASPLPRDFSGSLICIDTAICTIAYAWQREQNMREHQHSDAVEVVDRLSGILIRMITKVNFT